MDNENDNDNDDDNDNDNDNYNDIVVTKKVIYWQNKKYLYRQISSSKI